MKRTWLINLLVLPLTVGLLVGLLIAVFSFLLPKACAEKKEFSYSIDEPMIYLDKRLIGNIHVEIEGVETSLLVAYRIRAWNSGDIPIKNLPVRYVWDKTKTSPDFKIFNVIHETKPEFEFGKITEEGSDNFSKRFVYELLNPGDEIRVTFLTNEKVPLNLFTKAEGLSVQEIKPPIEKEKVGWPTLLAGIMGTVGAVLAMLFRLVSENRRRIQEIFRYAFKERRIEEE